MMGMRYMICQQVTNRFRPSELTKNHLRCPLTIMVTTTAFATGNDFSNVQLVILATILFNMCSAIQEMEMWLGATSYSTGSCYYLQVRAMMTFMVIN